MVGYIPELHAVGLNTSKSFGEAGEAAFLAKTTSLGFGVSKTWGDSEPYDFVLDSGQKLWRVQVKCTQRLLHGSRYSVKTSGCTARYTAEQIDFIVAYIFPEDIWYVVPVATTVTHSGMYFYPGGTRHSKYAKYREAWCQMACPRDQSCPNRLLVGRQQGYQFYVCDLCSNNGHPRRINRTSPCKIDEAPLVSV